MYSDKISDFHFIVSFSYQKVLLKNYDYLKIVSKWIILETRVFPAKTPQKNTIHHHFIRLNLSIIMLCLKIRVFSSKYFILKKTLCRLFLAYNLFKLILMNLDKILTISVICFFINRGCTALISSSSESEWWWYNFLTVFCSLINY